MMTLERTGRQLGRHVSDSNVNVGFAERFVSGAAGGLIAWAGLQHTMRSRSYWGLALSAIGGALAWRAISGHDPLYEALGVCEDDATFLSHPLSRNIEVRHSVTINRLPEDLYAFWRTLSNLPQVMRHLQVVEVLDERRSRWIAEGPKGTSVEWQAEIMADEPGRGFAWKSVEGSMVDTKGVVAFRPSNSGRGTVLTVDLTYVPPGGVAGAAIAKLLGREPAQTIREDLRRFKSVMEAGEAPTTSGQPQGAVC
jgi:uncharacterized membrane protein